MSLPIFEILYKECVNNVSELNNNDYKIIKETIDNMEDHSILWSIIRIYNIKYSTTNNYFEIPFNGAVVKSNKTGLDNASNNIDEINDIQLDIITRLDSNMSLPQYINNMSNQNTWGGGIEIKCFCNLFNIKVNVHISNNIIEFLPSKNTPIGQVNILYTGNHYEPIG